MNIDRVREGYKAIKDGMKLLDGGPLEFYMEKLTGCYDLLISRFSPFKVGDEVELAKTPIITEDKSWGWMGSRHFLKVGARGVVREVDVDGEGFTYYVAFEEDSWIESHTKRVHPYPPKERHTFGFREGWICSAAQRDEK